MGSEEAPIVWDGLGDVTIECGSHLIMVDSGLVLNNPNLKITGTYFTVLMVRHGLLTLEQGKIEYGGSDGAVIQVKGGMLAGPSQRGQFTLCTSPDAREVTGISYGILPYKELANLDIVLEGSGRNQYLWAPGFRKLQYPGDRRNSGLRGLSGSREKGAVYSWLSNNCLCFRSVWRNIQCIFSQRDDRMRKFCVSAETGWRYHL